VSLLGIGLLLFALVLLGVPIAIALAVTIPLSLLVGAIIGFMVRGNL